MDAKVIGAAVAAGVGVALAGWVVMNQLVGGREIRSASATSRLEPRDPAPDADGDEEAAPSEPRRRTGGGGPPPSWATPPATPEGGWSFPPARSAADAVAILDAGVTTVEQLVQGPADLGPLAGASKLGLVRAWRDFIAPVLAGDEAGFANAVASLGGMVGDDNALAGSVFRQLSTYLGGASVDTDAVTAQRVTGDDPREVPGMPSIPAGTGNPTGVPMMVEVSRTTDEAAGTGSERHSVQIPLASVFPDAARAQQGGAPVVRIWTPARMDGSKAQAPDCAVSTYFVWTQDRATWSPVAVRLTLESDRAKDKLRDAMRQARSGG